MENKPQIHRWLQKLSKFIAEFIWHMSIFLPILCIVLLVTRDDMFYVNLTDNLTIEILGFTLLAIVFKQGVDLIDDRVIEQINDSEEFKQIFKKIVAEVIAESQTKNVPPQISPED